ncbi:MAG: hypothetical protein NVSMB6_13940 [Burkholderiaceae bacterium]
MHCNCIVTFGRSCHLGPKWARQASKADGLEVTAAENECTRLRWAQGSDLLQKGASLPAFEPASQDTGAIPMPGRLHVWV